MIDINVTLWIQMGTFIIFLFLMNMVLYGPIRRMVAQRKQFISERQDRIERMDSDASTAVQEFNAKLQDARKLGRQKIQELKGMAYDEEKSLLQRAGEEAATQLHDMRAQIHKDAEAARKKLKGQVKVFSMDLAQKILGRSL